MIRLVVFLVALAAIAAGFAWLADRPGSLAISWQGYEIETSVLVAMVALLVAIVVASVLWSIARTTLRLPDLLGLFFRNRRQSRGLAALTRGMIAAGAGDPKVAKRAADEAQKLLGPAPLALLLQAQAAQLAGDRPAAAAAFAAMAERKDTRLLGLRGLWMEAQRRDDMVAARALAETAATEAPGLPWAAQAALETRAAAGDWSGALAAIDRNSRAGIGDKAVTRRHRAVLLAADALTRETGEPEAARTSALEALKLMPDLVPAAVVAGRLLGRAGELRKATKLIETAWKAVPHPDLADAYVHLRDADAGRDRIERARTLARLAPGGHPEGALAVARAALDAQDFVAARQALFHPVQEPTQRVCLLMAELEAAEHGDVGKAREWAARAMRARRDPAWVADGYVSDRWLPVSPVTGAIGAFEWKVPETAFGGAVLDHAVETALTVVEAASHAPPAEIAVAAPGRPEPAPVAEAPDAPAPPPALAAQPAAAPVVAAAILPDDPGPDTPDPESAGGRRKFRLFGA